jgi:fibro-slime domain-containing protein
MSKLAYLYVSALLLSGSIASCSANSSTDDELDGGTNSGGSSRGGNGTGAGKGGGNVGNTSGIPIPVPASCHDGTVQSPEECDDGVGHEDSGDGCSKGCRVEIDWTCPPAGGICTSTAICGNGMRSSAEACDDGNTDPNDGCSADCMSVEDGWQCRVAGKRCVPFCGDGKMIGTENCDDGQMPAASADGCSSTCLIEPGWSCTGTPSVCTKSVCGNAVVETGEACDKGDQNGLFFGDAMGCSKTCTQEPTCREGGVTKACSTACGDGNIDLTSGETCDDGNAIAGDGCSDTCQKEEGFTCTDTETPDTTICPSTGSGQCLVLPVTYRDFDGQHLPTGHPDFFYLSATNNCVPNASGRTVGTNGTCWDSDSTPLCSGIAQATLGADGKPALGTKTECLCRFTQWDSTDLPSTATCNDSNGGGHPRTEKMARVVQSADSFKQWYSDSALSEKTVGTLELTAIGTEYQFSSSGGRDVYSDLHDIFMGTGTVTSLSSGFFPLEASTRAKLCNLWPYWTVGTGACVAGDGNNVPQQWDPLGSYTPMMAGEGGPVKPVTGMLRNFYFTSEVRYLFRYAGSGTLAFYGDDDVWVYINGKLVLDLGAPHERLKGNVVMTGSSASWTILTTDITGAEVPPAAGGSGTVELGLETGKTYEIAVFHADRHPRESNYQLTLSGFATTKTACAPRCGDAVITAGEECDDGDAVNAPGVYNGCSTDCKYGPFCGDGTPDTAHGEECDLANKNGAKYGSEGCGSDCKLPHRCGDGIVDGAFGEECDDGVANGIMGAACTNECSLVVR